MLKERQQLVRQVVDLLAPAEHNIDAALSSVAGLNTHLPLARVTAGLALEVGHEAMDAFGEAQALLLKARGKIVEGHRCLAILRDDYRFPEVADGGLGNKSPNPPVMMRPVPAAA